MELVVATESRFHVGPDGNPWCPDGTYAYGFWHRYLEVFDRVTVIGRVSSDPTTRGHAVEGVGVRLCGLRNSRGVAGAVAMRPVWSQQLRKLIHRHASYCLRLPGVIGDVLWRELRRGGIPFGAEIVGDPGDVFASGTFQHPLRPMIRRWYCRNLAAQCRTATATAYVTRRKLQAKYPPSQDRFTTHYSSVHLDASSFGSPRTSISDSADAPWRLVSVGTMSQRYKGFDDLIDAVAQLQARGRHLHLTLVGNGRFESELRRQVRAARLENRVTFAGRIESGAAVNQILDQSDLFVLASHTEGLPRAMIEAQARGLPCLGTHVGGIPELLESSELVPPANPAALAQAIEQLLTDGVRMLRLSRQNLEQARQYSCEVLQRRRTEFYRRLRAAALSAHTGVAS